MKHRTAVTPQSELGGTRVGRGVRFPGSPCNAQKFLNRSAARRAVQTRAAVACDLGWALGSVGDDALDRRIADTGTVAEDHR